jgi:carbonic anhydrase
MTDATELWLDTVLQANARFRARIRPERLPVQRAPGTVAVITCMDPRVNLEAIGIPPFAEDGARDSSIRVIRTIGGMADARSLVIGMFLAGVREFAVLMHTDCGCCLAHSRIDTIMENMEKRLDPDRLQAFRETIGEPFRENLRTWLKAFEDPRDAVQQEVAAIRALPFMPPDVAIHGLVYEVSSGNVEVVVNGYQPAPNA